MSGTQYCAKEERGYKNVQWPHFRQGQMHSYKNAKKSKYMQKLKKYKGMKVKCLHRRFMDFTLYLYTGST